MNTCPNCHEQSVRTDENNGKKRKRCSSCDWTGPSCYGESWDPASKVCSGGYDPAAPYDEKTGGHKREKCGVFETCGQATKGRLLNIVPTNTLSQKPPNVAPIVPRNVGQPQLAQDTRQQLAIEAKSAAQRQVLNVPSKHEAQQGVQQVLQTVMVPIAEAGMPTHTPQNYQQPGSQMPGYLTVPEAPELGFWKRLLFSIGRGMAKGGLHTAANLVDHLPLSDYLSSKTKEGR